MISWLKKHFIPHEGNNHRPHILRTIGVRNIVIAVIFFEVFAFLIPTIANLNMSGGMAAVLPAVLTNLTNKERRVYNLQTLVVSPLLDKAAQMKATDMATNDYFAHTSPTGKTPWYWLEKVGYKYQYAGENLAINFSDSKDVTSAWMASPTHRANIEKGNYTEIGTGVAKGIYKGRETIFVAQVYANPLPKKLGQIKNKKEETKIIKEVVVATKNKKNKVSKESTNVLGIEVVNNVSNNNSNSTNQVTTKIKLKPTQEPTLFQDLQASPRNTTDIILYIIFGIITFALLLYLLIIFIKEKKHHKDLITNGLILLAIIGAIFVFNYYLTNHNMVINSKSIDYSNVRK